MLAAQRGTRTGGLSAAEDLAVARALMRNSHTVMATHIAVPTSDLTIPGSDSPLRARHYRPLAGTAPLLVFFHGGGFVVGDIESHDGLCRMICRDAAVHVLSVDYRLAPEHKAPAAVDDCVAVYRWALEHAADLGADPCRIGVGGDSAGGNLAALVALRSRDEGIRQPAVQVLLYPVVDLSAETRSRTLFSEGLAAVGQIVSGSDWYCVLVSGAGGGDRRGVGGDCQDVVHG
jgi:acetyl esterase